MSNILLKKSLSPNRIKIYVIQKGGENLPSMKNIVIVDGISTAGKTTFAKMLAKEKGYTYVDYDRTARMINSKFHNSTMFEKYTMTGKTILSQHGNKKIVIDGYIDTDKDVTRVLIHPTARTMLANYKKRQKEGRQMPIPRVVFNRIKLLYKECDNPKCGKIVEKLEKSKMSKLNEKFNELFGDKKYIYITPKYQNYDWIIINDNGKYTLLKQ